MKTEGNSGHGVTAAELLKRLLYFKTNFRMTRTLSTKTSRKPVFDARFLRSRGYTKYLRGNRFWTLIMMDGRDPLSPRTCIPKWTTSNRRNFKQSASFTERRTTYDS